VERSIVQVFIKRTKKNFLKNDSLDLQMETEHFTLAKVNKINEGFILKYPLVHLRNDKQMKALII